MMVKVGHTIHDGAAEPVMVILSERDKRNIAHMTPGCTRYCVYPSGINPRLIEAWMDSTEREAPYVG